jgi:hypothetical protein
MLTLLGSLVIREQRVAPVRVEKVPTYLDSSVTYRRACTGIDTVSYVGTYYK